MTHDPSLLVGSPRDPTFVHSVIALRNQPRAIEVLDLDRFCLGGSIDGRLDRPESLVFRDTGIAVYLSEFRSCYARFIDAPFERDEESGGNWARYRVLQIAVGALPMLVVNRPDAGESNGSKPLQTSLLERRGFRVPRSCSTSSEEAARDFVEKCPRGAIYKSNSGERSIVQAVTPDDVSRLR